MNVPCSTQRSKTRLDNLRNALRTYFNKSFNKDGFGSARMQMGIDIERGAQCLHLGVINFNNKSTYQIFGDLKICFSTYFYYSLVLNKCGRECQLSISIQPYVGAVGQLNMESAAQGNPQVVHVYFFGF